LDDLRYFILTDR